MGAASLLVIALLSAGVPRPVYVDPAGDDAEGNGTIRFPFQHLDRALSFIRSGGWLTGQTADQVIDLNTGTYSTPVGRAPVLTDLDSGSNGFKLKIVPTSGVPDDAKIYGGYHIPDSAWTLRSGSVYQALLPWDVRAFQPHDLVQGGRRAIYARSPNLVPDPKYPLADGPYFTSQCNGTVTDSNTLLQYNPVDIDPSTLTLGNVAIKGFSALGGGPVNWFEDEIKVTAIDLVNHRFTVQGSDGSGFKFGGCSGAGGAQYVVEGDVTLIDQNCEWAMCGPTSPYVCLQSCTGGAPADVWVPTTTRVVSIVGTDTAHPAHDITIDAVGLYLSDFGGVNRQGPNTYRFGQGNAGTTQDYGQYQQQIAEDKASLIYVEKAQQVSVTRAHLKLGFTALFAENWVNHLTLSSSWLEHCAADCLFGDGPPPQTADTLTNNTFDNLLITDAGERVSGSGIRWQQGSHTPFSRLKIARATRTLFVGTSWSVFPFVSACTPNFGYATNLTISGLRGFDALTSTGDQGGFTFEFGDGCMQTNLFTDSLISGFYAIASMTDFIPNCDFLDNKTSGARLHSIAAGNCASNRIRFNDNLASSHEIDPPDPDNDSFDSTGAKRTQCTSPGVPSGCFDPTALDWPNIGITANHPYATGDSDTLRDSFENGLCSYTTSAGAASCWTANSGSPTISTAQAFDGTHSLAEGFNGHVDYIWMGRHDQQDLRIRFFDDLSAVSMMVRCDDADPTASVTTNGNGWIALGVSPDDSTTNYSFWLGTTFAGNHHATTKARQAGWRQFDIIFDGKAVSMNVDGTQVVAPTIINGLQSCSRLAVGDFDAEGHTGTVFIDLPEMR